MRASFGYFSALPIGLAPETSPDAAALEALPFVGFVTGALAGIAGVAAQPYVPRRMLAPIVVAARLALTGAVHLDGFLDTCDAILASVSPERRLEILKDPRHGTYALAGFAVWLPLELAAVASMPARRLPLALAAAGMLARAAAIAQPSGNPTRFGRSPRVALIACACACGTIAGVRLVPRGVLLPLLALGVSAGLARVARNRFGGELRGDAYGWMIVTTETSLLAFIASGSGRH